MATKFCDSSARLCCGWSQAASGAAGWANVGLCPASSILHIISTCVVGGMCVCVLSVSVQIACVVVGCCIAIDIWNEPGLQLDDDNDDERASVSSHSEVAQLEDITGHHSSRAAEGADEILLCNFTDVSCA